MTNHRITTTAVVILSLAASTAPAATARPDFVLWGKQAPLVIDARPDKSVIPVTTRYRGASRRT